jgi:glucose/arabinose dehydrogenase
MLIAFIATASAQDVRTGPQAVKGAAPVPLPAEPVVIDTAEQHKIRVVVLAKGFLHPWSFAFLPDGSVLVAERGGRLRRVRGQVLDPEPIRGVPQVHVADIWGLMDIALHPRFGTNQLLYLTYIKPLNEGRFTIAMARGRFDGHALMEVRDIFQAMPPVRGASRIAFGADGMLYMTVAVGREENRAQDPNDFAGKVLRLRDEGSVPPDNPFVGRPGHRPEIYTLGHRTPSGLAVHPETGALWETEHGPQGGDELNVLLPGRNYGWPLVSFGRKYEGARVSESPWREGIEQPVVIWAPSIATSGLAFYTGDRFPNWKGNLFVSGMQRGAVPRTGCFERIVLNSRGEDVRRECLLTELKKRVRDVRQGPDGLLYALLEDDVMGDTGGETALVRIEPAP